ncbi:MAG: molybdenum cofactor guanylyltransferase [Deltaproteobacteria bacterium]|nr:molybdenum cofactor guanylyltransferase [Deltaproteobacteria bacterium]
MTASRPGFTGLDGFVLAGGRAARMGIDKARIPFPGRWPMAVHVAGVVEAACGRVTLVCRGPPDGLPWVTPDGRSLEVVRDADQGVPHPLNGLVTACAASRTPWLVVVPCDVPFLPEEAVCRLVAAATAAVGSRLVADQPADPDAAISSAVVARDEDRTHPLVGVFPRAVGRLAARAASEGRSAVDFTRHASQVTLPASWLRNVNAWEDTGRARTVIEDLAHHLPWVDGAAWDRLREGEAQRLRQRGVLVLRP